MNEILKLQINENDRLRKIISEKCEIIGGLKKSLEDFTSKNQIINEKFQTELNTLRKDNEKLYNLLENLLESFLDKRSLEIDEKLKMHAIKRAKIQSCVKSISSKTNQLSKQLAFYIEKTEKAEQELQNSKEKFVGDEKELKLNEVMKIKIEKLEELLNEKNVELNKVKHELDLATKSNFDRFVYMSSLEKRLADTKSNVRPPLRKRNDSSSSSSTGRYFCEPYKVMVNSEVQLTGYKRKNCSSKSSSAPLVAASEVKEEISVDLPEADPSSGHFCKIKFNSKSQLDEHKIANHKQNNAPYFKSSRSIRINRACLLADSPASQLANHPTNLFASSPSNPFFQSPANQIQGNPIFKPPVYNFQDSDYFDSRFMDNVKWF